jgi:hypothetical protein
VAALQSYWGKLHAASALPRGAPYVNGFHCIRDLDSILSWPDAQAPAELAIFACDFGRLQLRAGLPSLSRTREPRANSLSSPATSAGCSRARACPRSPPARELSLAVRATFAAALPTRGTAITFGRPCWPSGAACPGMATVPVRHAGPGLAVFEVPYCLSLRYYQWLAFSGRLRAGPSPLRSAIAHRRRRHSPRRAARSSPLRHSGPVGPAPIPRSLSSTTGALAASAPRARGAAAGASPGARPAPRRFALRDPRARPAPPDPFPSTYVRACRSGRRYVRRRSAVFTSWGDVRSLPVTTPHQWGDVVLSRRAVCPPRPTRRSTCVRAGRAAATIADAWRDHLRGEARAPSSPHPPLVGGVGGGRGPNLGKHRAGPALMGGGDGLGPVLSLSRTRSRCGTPIPIVIAPDGSNRCRRIKPLRRPTVSTLSLATVEAPTALSLIGCTNCALSRVSFGLNAGGAGAGPGRQLATCLRLNLLALAARPSPPWLNYRLVAQPSRLRPDHRHVGPRCFLSPRGSAPRPADLFSHTWPASADSH